MGQGNQKWGQGKWEQIIRLWCRVYSKSILDGFKATFVGWFGCRSVWNKNKVIRKKLDWRVLTRRSDEAGNTAVTACLFKDTLSVHDDIPGTRTTCTQPTIATSISICAIAIAHINLSLMALSNLGSLVLNLLIFITTLVNFSFALATLEPLLILTLYAISKIFLTPPEEGIFSRCQLDHLYQNDWNRTLRTMATSHLPNGGPRQQQILGWINIRNDEGMVSPAAVQQTSKLRTLLRERISLEGQKKGDCQSTKGRRIENIRSKIG